MTLNERPAFRNALVSATPRSRDTDRSRRYSAARWFQAREALSAPQSAREPKIKIAEPTPHDDERSSVSLPH